MKSEIEEIMSINIKPKNMIYFEDCLEYAQRHAGAPQLPSTFILSSKVTDLQLFSHKSANFSLAVKSGTP